MHRPQVSLLALAVLLAAPVAGQENGSVVDVDVTMHSEGGEHWFECAGPVCNEGRNPAMVLEPGRSYRFNVTNTAEVQHDLHVAGLDAETRLLDDGESVELEFTVPEDKQQGDNGAYFCSVHPQMRGTVVYETEEVGGGPIDNDSPAPGAPLLAIVLGAVLLLVDHARGRRGGP